MPDSVWSRPSSLPRYRRLSIVATLCLMLIMISSALQVMQAQPALKFETYKIANGLTVVLYEDHSAPLAATMVMYHVGSKNEKVKRTGFAHLFEHMMFQGSQHVADEEHFRLLQEVGGNVNGSTTEDRTNYFEVVPSNNLELALYLESDRMGFLLPAMTQEKLDNQRDVVKNERRQRVDNAPYGTAYEKLAAALYPPTHPYSWPVIGYMDDLSAASLQDVMEFFRVYYAPNNATLVIGGDFEPKQAKEWVEKYFGAFEKGVAIERPAVQLVTLPEEKRTVFEDKVQLPRLYLTWPSAQLQTRQDALRDVLSDILASGKNSRLYKALVYDKQIAQSVEAGQSGSEIAGEFSITVTAKPGKTLTEMETAVNEVLDDILKNGVTEREIEKSINNKEVQLINARQTVLGVVNTLATYQTLTGDAENVNREFARYKGITPAEILADAKVLLTANKVVLSIVPEGKTNLAAERKSLPRKEGVE
jgi:zinc protease